MQNILYTGRERYRNSGGGIFRKLVAIENPLGVNNDTKNSCLRLLKISVVHCNFKQKPEYGTRLCVRVEN